MANLTWSKNGEWGMDGVDLAALPPKLYGALYKLHELEHDRESLLEQLAKMMGVDQWELQDKLERSAGPWHPVEELPEMCIVDGMPYVGSRRLLVYTDREDVCMGYCEMVADHPVWYTYPPRVDRITHWMEIPKPLVSKMDTGEGGKQHA